VLSVVRYVLSKPGGRDGRAMAMKRNATANPWKGCDLSAGSRPIPRTARRFS
jgi:hypothetical protein